MAATLRGRPAHAPGPTFCSYTRSGKSLVSAGLNTAVRIFEHGSDDEPAIIDVTTENHLAVVAANDFFIVACEAGDVTRYSLITKKMDEILTRCAAPVRDLALSPDGQWVAVASDEMEVKVVNTQDMTKVLYLREQTRPAKNVSFDTSGSIVLVSCVDGSLICYSLSSETPQFLKRMDGLLKPVHSESEASARACWHPDGRAFIVPTNNGDLQLIARSNWQRDRAFTGGHSAEVSAAAWSPNGALLVSAGLDKSLTLWDARTMKIIKSFHDVRDRILDIHWHPRDNVVSYTNNNGELFIREDFVPGEHKKLLRLEVQRAPLGAEALSEVSGNARRFASNGEKPGQSGHQQMFDNEGQADDDDMNSLLGSDGPLDGGDDFIVDDDGAGYAEDRPQMAHRKRPGELLTGPVSKRQNPHSSWAPQLHASFQPGSTPWRGNRKYLCLNLTGFVWTVNQETHHTVTVEFYNNREHRDFHFTDPFQYDKACLSEKGTLFSCPSTAQHPAVIYYRPHETWTTRTEWRINLPVGEQISSLSLSDSCIVATTTAGYVRIYSLFGLPLRVYRQKSTPAVTCTSWHDYVLTVGNGAVGGDGRTRLVYTIEHVRRDEVCQKDDILALPEGTQLRSIFFSDRGDPCIYDSDGVLLILEHWRVPGQARWVPLLDTRTLSRLATGRKDENYWPVAVANDRFHCIILKGGEQYPYFPRPLLSDFEFSIPIHPAPERADDDDDEDDGDDDATSVKDHEAKQQRILEEQHVRFDLQLSLLQDVMTSRNSTSAQRSQLALLEREVDKALLQLLAIECRAGEHRAMKALEIASLMKDRSGKMHEAAVKVAQRFQRDLLAEKITALAERRLVGLVDEDGDD